MSSSVTLTATLLNALWILQFKQEAKNSNNSAHASKHASDDGLQDGNKRANNSKASIATFPSSADNTSRSLVDEIDIALFTNRHTGTANL